MKHLFAIALIIAMIASCKKNSTQPSPSFNLEGAFVGSWQVIGTGVATKFSLYFHNNGDLLVQLGLPLNPDNTPNVARGRWVYQGDSIVANCEILTGTSASQKFSLAAKFSSVTQTTIIGTLGNDANTEGTASFEAARPDISSIEGAWIGNYSYIFLNPHKNNLPYALYFNDDNTKTVIVESSNPFNPSIISIGVGTWQQVGDSIKATCINKVNGTATFSIAVKRINKTIEGAFGLGTDAYSKQQGILQVQKK